MVLGRDQPVAYVSAYTGLTALGAAVGVGVVALAPQLIITPMEDALNRLWLTITARLRQLIDDLGSLQSIGIFGEEELAAARARLRDTLRTGQEGARLNLRSRRYRVSDRRARAEAVDDLAARLAELLGALKELESDPELPRRAEVNAAFAEALGLILTALRDGERSPLGDQFAGALAQLDRFVGELPAIGPGRHAVGRTVDCTRRVGAAAGRAIELTVRPDESDDPAGRDEDQKDRDERL
jgi:hypothetical protein